MTKSPVLFIVFNRPETSQKVLKQIIKARPSKLYIAGDGARNKAEEKVVNETRALVSNMSEGLNVEYLWRDKNLGCKKGVIGAINWFFENEESGIILEDDCLPSSSFFSFCDETLEKYKDTPEVMHIAGSNLLIQASDSTSSYYFTRLPNIWGWATWKRAWNQYDSEMSKIETFKTSSNLKDIIKDPKLRSRYIRLYEKIYNGVDTWDFQWTYSNIINNGLSIIPNKNLITNIGFGVNATHSIDPENPLANLKLEALDQINHPNKIAVDQDAEKTFLEITNHLPPLHLRIINKIKKVKNLLLN
jgi:hypothetical protein